MQTKKANKMLGLTLQQTTVEPPVSDHLKCQDLVVAYLFYFILFTG